LKGRIADFLKLIEDNMILFQ